MADGLGPQDQLSSLIASLEQMKLPVSSKKQLSTIEEEYKFICLSEDCRTCYQPLSIVTKNLGHKDHRTLELVTFFRQIVDQCLTPENIRQQNDVAQEQIDKFTQQMNEQIKYIQSQIQLLSQNLSSIIKQYRKLYCYQTVDQNQVYNVLV